MKKILAIMILILVSVMSYGQGIVKTRDFEVTEAYGDGNEVKGFQIQFHPDQSFRYIKFGCKYVVSKFKTDSKGVITEMFAKPDDYVYDTDLLKRYFGYELGLDNLSTDTQATAKYRASEYTYIIDMETGYIKITLNK